MAEVNERRGAGRKRVAKKKRRVKSKARVDSSTRPRRRKGAAADGLCFMVSPFGGWYDEYYIKVYRPAIEAAGLVARRADDLYRPSAIVQDIWNYVKEARVIVADLTGKNANVFYELGLAHALDKPVVLLAQSMDDVPADLRALRVLLYNLASPDWAEILRESIKRALAEVLESPSTAVLQPFHRETAPRSPNTEKRDDLVIQQLVRDVNILRSELLRRDYSVPRQDSAAIVGPDELQGLILSYVAQGVPIEDIVDRVSLTGAPRSWIERVTRDTVKRIRPDIAEQS